MAASNQIPSNYQIKFNQCSDEGELGIDIQPVVDVDVDPATMSDVFDQSVSNACNNIDTTMEIEADEERNDADTISAASICKRFRGYAISSRRAAYILAAFALLGVCTIAGIGLSGIIELKRQQQQTQQNALTAISATKRGGKAGKSALTMSCMCGLDPTDKGDENDFCADDHVVECGATFTNEKVVLSDNLFCKENYWFAPAEELMALNAAITLVGPDASIDCKGHSIRQRTLLLSFASQCLDLNWRNEGNPFESSNERKQMKMTCHINYQAGILLVDGAKAINCNVEDFYDGFLILNGGSMKKSEAVGNRNGITIQDVTGSIDTRVSDVYAHNNYKGIYVLNHASSNSVTIEDVTSKHNPEYGMMLRGPDIIVKDSTSSYNGKAGIYYHTTYEYDLDFTTNIQFEGKVSSHNNLYNGIEFDLGRSFSTYLNGEEGLHITSHPFQNVLFTVEDKGSWSSCQNSQADVVNSGGGMVTFFDESGDGYTCDTREGLGLPSCMTCPVCNTRALMNFDFENGQEQGDNIEDEDEDAALASTITTATAKRGGKAGKAASCVSEHDPVNDEEEFCAKDEIISCGVTFTNEEVVLSEDLFCTDRHYDASEDELMALNAAITLSGPEASIDCKGHTIRQVTAGYFGSQCLRWLDRTGDPFEPSSLRADMKTWCDLYYQVGILLVDGATAVNCNVENFLDGFLVLNGGEVMSSEASGNKYGVTIHDLDGSVETTVSDLCVHDNMRGIFVYNRSSVGAVTIQDVKSTHNSEQGAYFYGPDVTVKDSIFSNNEYGVGFIVGSENEAKVTFEGKVSSYDNGWFGIAFGNNGDYLGAQDMEVNVNGDVKTYMNGGVGLATSTVPSNRVRLMVKEKSSFTSCQNSGPVDAVDIVSQGPYGVVSFIDEGSEGYVCDTIEIRDDVQALPEPTCVTCPVCM